MLEDNFVFSMVNISKVDNDCSREDDARVVDGELVTINGVLVDNEILEIIEEIVVYVNVVDFVAEVVKHEDALNENISVTVIA